MPFVLMVAGPNGSGKTTLTRRLAASGIDFGVYINPDDIAAELAGSYAERVAEAQRKAEASRTDCLEHGRSFSFETVMSHPSKIETLRQAHERGFTTLLYFVATSNPQVNVERVGQRVALGGHDVPADRIVSRYQRTLALLPEAVAVADRCFLFDNTATRAANMEPGLRLVATVERVESQRVVAFRPPTPQWALAGLEQIMRGI